MVTISNIDHSITDDGIDRKRLAQIKHAFLSINQERRTRTLAVLSERQQQLLTLLPLLFHVNHPMLPGYISHHVPAGIKGYTPSKEDISTAKIIARSFNYLRDLAEKVFSIDALFIMGSLGSIAHSETSDIDVWVCHQPTLDEHALNALQQKCDLICRWAADVAHIETHFFLMNAKTFSEGKQSLLSGEASGSAQHFLLLDEFYRSAVWLAGKIPLWWFVPAEQENNYLNVSDYLLKNKFIRRDDVIDFGGVAAIPSNEFLGAGVWQLYKGIDSPYKSVLKLLLLETYTHEIFGEPLCLELKRKIYLYFHANNLSEKKGSHDKIEMITNTLDPYVLIYYRLENYLLQQNQSTRLELIRRCFYFKAGKLLSKSSRNIAKSWKRIFIETLIQQWGWDHHLLTMLDNRDYWKSPQVIAERNLLANELDQAYRLLVDINKESGNEAAISNDELVILGRKLHAAFEKKAGKIDWINPHISQDMSEPAICIVETDDKDMQLWKAYRGNQQDLALHTQNVEPIKKSRYFIELLLWCYCNGLLTEGTKIDIVSQHIALSTAQKKQLLNTIQHWLPLPALKPPHEAFLQASQPNQLLLLINIGVEPQPELYKKGMQMLSNQSDALGYSGFKENLVVTLDIVQSNTWGEIVSRHFSEDAIVQGLLHYLRLVPRPATFELPELNVRCFNTSKGNTIEQRVTALWHALIDCFYSNTQPFQKRFLFEMAEEYFLVEFFQQQPQVHRFKHYEKLLDFLNLPQIESSQLVVDSYALRDRSLRLIRESTKSKS